MSKFMERAKEEFSLILLPTVFFFVALHIVALIRSLMSKGEGVPISSTASITVATFILGKAVLLADALLLINRYPHRLAFNVAWKTLIFIALAVIRSAQRLIEAARKAGGLMPRNAELLSHMVGPRFWVVQILLFALMLMYCTMHELVRMIGKGKVKRICFGPMPFPTV